jgi:hypothetical protein
MREPRGALALLLLLLLACGAATVRATDGPCTFWFPNEGYEFDL